MSNDPDKTPEEDPGSRRAANPEGSPNRPGAEGGSQSSDADNLPSHPSDSDSELGDTDQHSSA